MKAILISLAFASTMVQAQKEIDPNELLCYSLAVEMLESQFVTQDQAQAWTYLGCVDYEDKIAPAVAAYLGSKNMGDRYK